MVDETKRIEQDADIALKAALAQYNTLKAACDARKVERAEVQPAHAGAEASWSVRNRYARRSHQAACRPCAIMAVKMQARRSAESALNPPRSSDPSSGDGIGNLRTWSVDGIKRME